MTGAASGSAVRLRCARLEAFVDPRHGAEVVSLRELESGLELLGQVPWKSATPVDGELDEDAWTGAYRGGWQLLTPSAGDACEVDGAHHGFHGRASHAPWELVDHGADEAALRWRGEGLIVTRRYRLSGSTVEAATTWEADERTVPMVHVEHVTVGAALLDPAVELRLPGGSVERLAFVHDRASFSVLRGFADGVAELVNVTSGIRVRLEWEAAELPFAWLWHELRGSGGIWGHRAELLGFEPASTSQAGGLAKAIEQGEATWVEPGRPVERRIVLHVERA